MGSLYLIRHGQASFGSSNYDALSELGRQQARILGSALLQKGLRVDRALQGTMQRHQETASLCLAEMLGPPPVESAPWLNEFDHEAILCALHPNFSDPRNIQDFMRSAENPAKAFHKEFEKAMLRWMTGQYAADYTESYAQFKQRVQGGVQELLRVSGADSNLLLFTSGGPIASLLQLALDLSDEMMLRLNGAIVNASLSRLPFQGDRLFLSYFNDHAHFAPAGSPLLTYR